MVPQVQAEPEARAARQDAAAAALQVVMEGQPLQEPRVVQEGQDAADQDVIFSIAMPVAVRDAPVLTEQMERRAQTAQLPLFQRPQALTSLRYNPLPVSPADTGAEAAVGVAAT